MIARRLAVISAAVFVVACAHALAPAALDTKNDACAFCRMIVSDERTASQIVAPLEEPRFFDDFGCLASYLASAKLPADAVLFVADHRTKEWVRADAAIFTRLSGSAGAMGSHIVAHASAVSRDADPDSGGGTTMPIADVLGAGHASRDEGRRRP
jgi:copper chaperone NosL